MPADNSLLARLFLLDSKNIKESVNKKRDYYTPKYWYFVLEDSKHIKKYEWSEYTTSDDEYAKNSLDEINDYEIGIHYNLELNDGMIDETSISSTRNETPRELFDKFFDREKVKMKK